MGVAVTLTRRLETRDCVWNPEGNVTPSASTAVHICVIILKSKQFSVFILSFARRRRRRPSARSVAVTGTRRVKTVTEARNHDATISRSSSAHFAARRATTTDLFCAKPALPTTTPPISSRRLPLGCDYNRLRFAFDLTAIHPPFDSHWTAIRPRYDHSTTCVTNGLLHCSLNQ